MKQSLAVSVLCLSILALVEGQSWYKYNSISKYYNLDKSNRVCDEKPLEVREKNADIIFTGTIRDMEPDASNYGTKTARVQIKRVMKGGFILSRIPRLAAVDGAVMDHRKEVMVEGIGDPGICNSEAKVRDSRIFLLNKASNGHLKLNSSLVRITLDNIEKAEAVVKDMIQKSTVKIHRVIPSMTEAKDPCSGRHCSYGARCVASLDGLTARCLCPDRCDSFGDSVGSGVVCGSDARNYASLCELKRRSCELMRDIEKKYDGKCDPCDGFECPVSQICQLDSSRRPICTCDTLCPMVFEPVCGSNGKTYSNECLMKVDACKQRVEIWLLFREECTAGNNPCHGVTCGLNRLCIVDSSYAAHCTCPHVCDAVLKPVCGDDGHTYPSECHLQRQSCIEKRPVAVAHVGECNTISVCTNHLCQHEAARCVIRSHQAICVCPLCSEEYQPVCGSNEISYTNECKMKTENCEKMASVAVAYRGLCDACKHKRCDFYSECVSNGRNGALCVCPTCNEVNAKVCGSDGSTYNNECELRVHSCRRQIHIFLASNGPCDPCANVKCKYGAKCFDGRCVCDYDCSNISDPVCGSDDRTYPNECVMQRVACSQGVEVEAHHAGNCEESSGSGDDAPVGACDTRQCQHGGICKIGRRGIPECTCSFNCDAVRDRVCGSDGQTYGNECQLREESCRKQTNIRVLPMSSCEDMFEELCDGKPALVNRESGSEYECFHSSGCPAGSYCHRLSGVGKCCVEDQPALSIGCSESRHGCCPDGVTAALGPRSEGCPNSCQCHALGANGSSCDPITRQCACKEGVGGLKCDRCNPSYWGLPKISEGNRGCIPCDCNILGSMREDCEQMTGRCTCRPGITGQKCSICPSGRQLEASGCTDLMFNDHLIHAMTCKDKQCRFGAICQMTNGNPECVCPSTCQPQDDLSMMVCGSDLQTYGSSCHLKRSACRLQKDIRVTSKGACQKISAMTTKSAMKSSSDPPPPLVMMKTRKTQEDFSLKRVIKDLTNPANMISTDGKLDEFCQTDRDCLITGSYCKNGLCSCQNSLLPSGDGRACIAERFVIPSFNGRSYLQLKRFDQGSRDVAIEIQFQPQRENGILIYSGRGTNGTGDFLSLSLRSGHVEFRYDLGSGMALLKTPEKVKIGMFHKVTAMRFGKDGILRLDEGLEVSSTSPGMMRSLNLVAPIYLGFVPNLTDALSNNIGVRVGFVGCVELLSIKSSELSLAYDLTQDSSVDIEQQHEVHECGISSCSSSPCLNGGRCVELDAGMNFECSCLAEFTGDLCDELKKAKNVPSCASNPCQNGGSCLQLDNGHFVCNCPHSHDGDKCERAFMQDSFSPFSVTAPQFHGDSFITLRLSKAASHSFSFEIWFLPIQPDGVLLYSAQENVVKGDFIALNLIDGYAQLRYDLGSGIANITSQTKVRLGMWNKVAVSRLNRLGSLSLNDDNPAKGQSTGGKKELNLPMRIYVGGYPNEFNPESEVKSGFVGAIQKFFRDKKPVENLLAESLAAVHITQYVGPPCPLDNNPCHNGGTCVPNLNDFECRCSDLFYGITCQMRKQDNASSAHHPIAFNGHNHHRYDAVTRDRNQDGDRIEVKFRTEAANGLLVLMQRSESFGGDYVAIAVRGGHVQVSFDLGREKSSQMITLVSHFPVTDNQWHNATFTRVHRSAHLYVDHDWSTVPVPVTPGAAHLDTKGQLWLGGCAENKPRGLPKAFYLGFKGCIEIVKVDRKTVNLVEDRDKTLPISFCADDI